MKLSQVAAQLYTVRDFCKTTADLASTAKKVREIGYTAVQVSGIGPISEAEVVAIMEGEGLTICATHEPSHTLLDEPQKVIDRLQRLGCRLTAYPSPRDVDLSNAEHVRSLARRLDASGAKLREAGITLAYHNHGLEFVRFEGRPVLDFIYGNTRPENLKAELDTYWVHFGGGDVVQWCERLRGRLPCIHIKDYVFTLENKPTFAEIGQGTLPFKRIIDAAEASGCQWFIVEQDRCAGSPFESLRTSFDYLKDHLVER